MLFTQVSKGSFFYLVSGVLYWQLDFAEPKMLDFFEQAEIDDSTLRKEVDGRIIYMSPYYHIIISPLQLVYSFSVTLVQLNGARNKTKRDAPPNPFRLVILNTSFLVVTRSISGTSAA